MWYRKGIPLLSGTLFGAAGAALWLYFRQDESEDVSEKKQEDGEGILEEESGPIVMCLFLRKDLKMGAGKQVAQCSHASAGVWDTIAASSNRRWKYWMSLWEQSSKEINMFRATSEEELMSIRSEVRSLRLPSYLVKDAGRTQIAAGSRTVFAVGPVPLRLLAPISEEWVALP
eukprot:NODE_4656_length_780_cov_22.689466_g4312_i0.p1 GENE.NODE_4656_length_780_cov_22.689466_g4312_i0~~NODE_4656_length_780_cov_22.689466_g4312_i0.p1  ORF type:complete len:173 (-),score=36.27 NODE_4656_length_780_cov_22.689466_g4312_i0:166-684(-)